MIINYPFSKNEIILKLVETMVVVVLKMSFEVANVENPNRKDNKVVFSIFEAKEYRVNIKLALECFKTQI